MRKILLVFALGFSLSACAQLTNAWDTLTGASVSPTAVYVAANSFDAVEITATNYLNYCKTHITTSLCNKQAIAALIPAVRSGRLARTNLEQFLQAHPDAIGAAGLYDALIAATTTLQGIETQYNIGAAK